MYVLGMYVCMYVCIKYVWECDPDLNVLASKLQVVSVCGLSNGFLRAKNDEDADHHHEYHTQQKTIQFYTYIYIHIHIHTYI